MIEGVLFTVVGLSYVWFRDRMSKSVKMFVLAVAGTLAVLGPMMRDPKTYFSGFLFTDFWEALLLYFLGGAIILAVIYFMYSRKVHQPTFGDMVSPKAVAKHFGWGLAQQTIMLTFLVPQMGWGAAVVFALFHMPNVFLSAVTLAGGFLSISIWMVIGQKSLLAAGLIHAIMSELIDSSLPESVTGGMRIGKDYLKWAKS